MRRPTLEEIYLALTGGGAGVMRSSGTSSASSSCSSGAAASSRSSRSCLPIIFLVLLGSAYGNDTSRRRARLHVPARRDPRLRRASTTFAGLGILLVLRRESGDAEADPRRRRFPRGHVPRPRCSPRSCSSTCRGGRPHRARADALRRRRSRRAGCRSSRPAVGAASFAALGVARRRSSDGRGLVRGDQRHLPAGRVPRRRVLLDEVVPAVAARARRRAAAVALHPARPRHRRPARAVWKLGSTSRSSPRGGWSG